jgi:hypothetical protein
MSKRRHLRVPRFILAHPFAHSHLAPLYRRLRRVLPFRLEIDVIQPRIPESRAWSPLLRSNVGAIYINDTERFEDGVVGPEEYESLRDELITGLRAIRDPQQGSAVVAQVWKREEVYWGEQLRMAPDIVFMSESHLIDSAFRGRVLLEAKNNAHSLDGIFLAYGTDIKQGAQLGNARIYDLAPTILHLLDVPMPSGMDGEVLKSIFEEGSDPRRREPLYASTVEFQRLRSTVLKLRRSGRT